MKKLFLLAYIIFVLASPSFAYALNLGGDILEGAAKGGGYSPATTETTFSETLGTVVKGALSLVGVIFMILMVYAGFLWLNAKGEESQIEKAQDIIRSSIIGLIITVGAYSITQFVVPRIISRATGGPVQGNIGTCHWEGGSANGTDTSRTRSNCRSWCNERSQSVNSVTLAPVCTFQFGDGALESL